MTGQDSASCLVVHCCRAALAEMCFGWWIQWHVRPIVDGSRCTYPKIPWVIVRHQAGSIRHMYIARL